jgi:hypothetical protein
MLWTEENADEPVCAEDPPQLSEAKKRNEHNEQQCRDRQNSLPSAAPKIRDAFMERLSVKAADSEFFSDLEASKHNGEHERL